MHLLIFFPLELHCISGDQYIPGTSPSFWLIICEQSMFIQWKKLQSLGELRLEHSCSTAGNSVVDLYLAPKLVPYKAVYWAVPAWFFIVCLTLFLANCCIVFDGFIPSLISSFTVKRWGPWPAGQSFCRSPAGSRAQGGRVDCMGELLPLRLLLPSLAFSFFWLQSLSFSVESQQRGKCQRTDSPLGGR